MEKIDSSRLLKNLKEIKLKHYQRMIPITTMGIIYSCLTTPTKDEDLNEFLQSLEKDLKKIGIGVDNYLFGSLLITSITEVELFLTDTLYCIIKTFPKKIKNMKFDYNDIIDKSNDELIQLASQRYINELMYKKPIEYLESFCQIASIDPTRIMVYWPAFIEAKARRDLGIHNNWTANEVYLKKLKEVKLDSRFSLGESAYPDNTYVGRVHDNSVALIESLDEALVAKYGS